VAGIALQDVADEIFHGDLRHAEGVLASMCVFLETWQPRHLRRRRALILVTSSRIKADRARQVLGWSPKYGEAEFLEEIDDVVAAMFEQQRA